jgi:hypothetical protein
MDSESTTIPEADATVPELGDEAEPFQMLLVVDARPAATVGLREDVDGLVEADRARRVASLSGASTALVFARSLVPRRAP